MNVNGESEEKLQAGRLKLKVKGVVHCWFIRFDFQPSTAGKGEGTRQP